MVHPEPIAAGFAQACVHELFDRVVERSPGAIAVRGDGVAISYSELEQRSNRLAWRLVHLGIGPDVLVGLCADHHPQTLVAILAILKAGGAYVPFDPAYPAQRLAFMAEDTACAAMIARRERAEHLPAVSGDVIILDEETGEVQRPTTSPDTGVRPGSLAYVMYTSGSTGDPKGVMVEHRSLVNVALDGVDRFGLQPADRVQQFCSLSFDASVGDLFTSWLAGASLVPALSGRPAVARSLETGVSA